MSAPRRSAHPSLPFADWPYADRAAWAAARRRPDFLDPGGRGANWRPASERAAEGAYGRLLAWLQAQGVDLEAEAPVARITRDRLRCYVTFLKEGRSSVTVASYLGVLCMVLVAMFPDEDWRWLQAAQRWLKRRSRPSRRKQDRLVPVRQLFQLGQELMQRAERVLDEEPAAVSVTARVAAARDYRDALMICLLASRPLRVKNLLQIEIGNHLRQSGSRVTLHFQASETKTHRAHDTVWPESLGAALQRYVAEVRPMLCSAVPRSQKPQTPHAILWVAQGGSAMTYGALSKAIDRHTIRRFGHPITAHLFRACSATTVGNEDPAHVAYASQLLGHASLRTTERNYIAADSSTALAHYHDLMAAIGKNGGRPSQ
jgi:integrase/recombinase XerD